ncbi:hypothetical protein POM88_034277 [Heracleum sosnowskyi]|uniref:Uncharacterized protein n=1 Tax=Heracleum sosnowskyi TaxID=360622 RepID=A0AAD8HLC1_9APIA|nr:hypothetical protein POM88_034277 [Heracleum sosnowskyi]
MGSATTVFSVMLLFSLVMTSTFVSAARQLNEISKVGEQNTNSENTRIKIGSEANEKTLDDKKFFLPFPSPLPELPPFPFTQTLPGFPPMSLPALPNFFTPPSGN